MATINLKVNTDRLSYDLDSLEGYFCNLKNDMEIINQGINALNGMWSGEAKDTLITGFNETFELVENTLENFNEYIEILKNDKREYDVCEAGVTSLMQGI